MAKVHRRGVGPGVKKANKHHKRGCRSAPALPSTFTVTYFKRQIHHDAEWAARVKWSPVTLDVAGRPLSVEEYEVRLRATNASSVPVEVNDTIALTAATASGGVATFTTTSPHGYSADDDVTVAGVTPSAYNGAWKVLAAGLTSTQFRATIGATPGAGSAFGTAASHDFWSQTEKAHGPTANERVIFHPLPRPKTYYFQARLRVLNRVHGTKCWSAWTSWSAATQPVSGAIAGPASPTGLNLVLDKVEGSKKRPWRARVGWNEIGTYTPTDGDPLEGVDIYHVQFAVSNDGGATNANIRNKNIPADPTLTTNKADFFNIKRKRSYRARVKAKDHYGHWGAYTSWTSWESIGGDPDDVTNVVCTNPTVGTLKTTWDLPADLSDVDGIKVVIRRKDGGGGTIVETDEIGPHRTKYMYDIPFADRQYNHTAKVHTFDDEINLDIDTAVVGWDVATVSAGVESSDTVVDREVDIDELDITTETRKLIRPSGVPRVRLRRAASQSFSDANDAFMDWDTVDVDTDSFDLGTGAVEIPTGFGGSFRVTAVARWATNGTGRRLCRLQRDTGSGYFDMVTLYDVRGALVGDVTVTQMTNTVQLDAGDKLRVEGWQNSGGALNVNDASLAVEFLGPA